MANTNKNGKSFTKNLTMVAILTAITVVLQIVALVSRPFLPFSITLSLFPIVIGAALCGPVTSSWLGFAFGVTVLLSGDAAAFLTVNIPGTIITVLAKGTLAGLAAGLIFRCFLLCHCCSHCKHRCISARLQTVLYGHDHILGGSGRQSQCRFLYHFIFCRYQFPD